VAAKVIWVARAKQSRNFHSRRQKEHAERAPVSSHRCRCVAMLGMVLRGAQGHNVRTGLSGAKASPRAQQQPALLEMVSAQVGSFHLVV
jgi:hypothetical protein